jgi:hypothetical protein
MGLATRTGSEWLSGQSVLSSGFFHIFLFIGQNMTEVV